MQLKWVWIQNLGADVKLKVSCCPLSAIAKRWLLRLSWIHTNRLRMTANDIFSWLCHGKQKTQQKNNDRGFSLGAHQPCRIPAFIPFTQSLRMHQVDGDAGDRRANAVGASAGFGLRFEWVGARSWTAWNFPSCLQRIPGVQRVCWRTEGEMRKRKKRTTKQN